MLTGLDRADDTSRDEEQQADDRKPKQRLPGESHHRNHEPQHQQTTDATHKLCTVLAIWTRQVNDSCSASHTQVSASPHIKAPSTGG